MSITPDVLPYVVRWYRDGRSLRWIAVQVNSAAMTVRAALLGAGVSTRPIGAKGARCVDCGKATKRHAKRCDYHNKIRTAARDRESKRRRYGYKNPYLAI